MLSRLVITFLPRGFGLGITVSCSAGDQSEVRFAPLSAVLCPVKWGVRPPGDVGNQCTIPTAVGMLAAFKGWSISGVLVTGVFSRQEPLLLLSGEFVISLVLSRCNKNLK